jgi:predicted lipoprotein with Yx(FWY)xxD motif
MDLVLAAIAMRDARRAVVDRKLIGTRRNEVMRTWKPSTTAAVVAATAMLTAGCGSGSDESRPAAPAPQSVGATVAPSGGGALSLVSGTPKSNDAEPGSGDWAYPDGGPEQPERQEKSRKWASLRATSAGGLDPVVVNGAGFTLYRFDDDDAKPSMSNCAGDCAKTWPPVTVKPGAKVFVAGVKKAKIGFLQREDGGLQVTIGGWPVYRFSKDARPGDTKGQGVKGTWFAVTPDGKRAAAKDPEVVELPEESADQPEVVEEQPEQPSTGTAEPQPQDRTVTLFDDADFGAGGASQDVSGADCQNVPSPGVASSLTVEGTLRMWSKKDCKGEVREVDGDVRNLASIDFDDTVVSIRLA